MDKSGHQHRQITIPEKAKPKDSSPNATFIERETTKGNNSSSLPTATQILHDPEKSVIEYDHEGKPIKRQAFSGNKHEEDIESSNGITNEEVNAVDFEPVFLPTIVRIPLMIGLSLGVFVIGLDNTIVATAMPKIASQFGALDEVSWIATSYIFTLNAFLPLVGRFADVFGRRPVMLAGFGLFLVGSALCGSSTSMIMLIIMRAIQGIGGGAAIGTTFIVFADISSLKDRAKYQALVATIYSVSSILGPLIGGSFTDHVSWRWAFYINLPIGAFTTAIVVFALKLPPVQGTLTDKLKQLDYVGTALIISTVITALLAVTWGGVKYAWNSPVIIILFVLSGLCIIGLFFCEVKYARDPIIPARLFKTRTANAIYIGTPLFLMNFFSILYFLPIFWQVVKYVSATLSGLRLIPITAALLISSNLAAYLVPRLGRVRELLMAGAAFGAIGTGLISLYKEDDSTGMEVGFLLIFGFGIGLMWSLAVVAVQSATDAKDLAAATSLVTFFQMLGGSIGVAISSSIFFNHLHDELVKILPMDQVVLAQNSVAFVHSLPDNVQPLVIHAYTLALRRIWYVQSILTGVSFVAMMFVKNYKLKKDP